MGADFENMGYEAVPEIVSRIKWPPNPIKGSPKLYDLSPCLKWPPISKKWAMKR